MLDLLNFLIGTPLACATGYLLAKLFALDGLAKWIAARVPFFNRLPWVEKPTP